MVGSVRDNVPIPGNDVVDWLGQKPVVKEYYTGSSEIKPGMLLRGSTHVCHAMAGSGNVIGYALYKESAPKAQKADYTSAYDKGEWIAVLPLGVSARIYGWCGTITATQVGAMLKPDGTTAGAVSPMALVWSGSQVIQAKISARALAPATSGAGERAMIQVG